jgi:hypothetical protein
MRFQIYHNARPEQPYVSITDEGATIWLTVPKMLEAMQKLKDATEKAMSRDLPPPGFVPVEDDLISVYTGGNQHCLQGEESTPNQRLIRDAMAKLKGKHV